MGNELSPFRYASNFVVCILILVVVFFVVVTMVSIIVDRLDEEGINFKFKFFSVALLGFLIILFLGVAILKLFNPYNL